MNPVFNPNTSHSPSDQAVLVASGLLDAAGGPAVKAVGDGVDQLRANAGPALRELASGAQDMARGRLRAAREQATHLRESGVVYVREHPLQSLAWAVAAGVGAMLVLGLLSSHRHSR